MADTGGITWKPVSEEWEQVRRKIFDEGSNQLDGLISEPYGVPAPKAMEAVAKKIYNFELRPDDIWIVTYPKCGTTWTQVTNLFLTIFEMRPKLSRFQIDLKRV